MINRAPEARGVQTALVVAALPLIGTVSSWRLKMVAMGFMAYLSDDI